MIFFAKRPVFSLCIVLGTLFFGSAATSSSHSFSVHKSPNDKRTYEAFELPNQMKVVIISDPDTDKSAAALDIAAGSGNDPDNRLGFAHFLEHMLFLGTEKYPEAGEYQEYIARHGGNHNAYTSFQHTNYFFDIDARFFEQGLDRFSQQFVSPLFNETYVNRERNAVHSEFTAKIKDDYRRNHAAFRAAINPEHAYSRFTVGDANTLSSDDNARLREDLVKFYESNYSANLMTLAVYGKEDINTLKQWVTSRFGDVKNRHLPMKSHPQPLFRQNTLPQLLQITPNMDKMSMQLSFSLPSQMEYFRNKPDYYISNLIGHEGAGSLLSVLKEKGYANSLSSGTSMDTGNEALFSINYQLTPKGLKHWRHCIELTMTWIDLIRTAGKKKFYFEEQKQMLDLAFKFQERSTPFHFASRIANEMHQKPISEVIRGSYLMEQYSPDLYDDVLAHLTPENAFVTLSAKGLKTESKTERYDTEYSLSSLPPEIFTPKKESYALFKLPEENAFIPWDISMTDNKSMSVPKLLEKQKGFESWFSSDTDFNTPKSIYYVNLRSPIANNTPLNSVKTSLLVELLKDELTEFSYPAYLAGLNFQVYGHVRGITIRIEGYPQKQFVLLNKILGTLTNLTVRQERLTIYAEKLKRSLENSDKGKPYEQTITEARLLLTSPLWSDRQKLDVIDKVNKRNLQQFASELFDETEIVTLNHGNTGRANALNLNQLVKAYIYNQARHVIVPSGKVSQLGDNERAIKHMEIDHPDTSYVLLVQGRDTSWDEKAKFAIASQIAATRYYREMRTEKQLGYVVFAMPFSMFEVPGTGFVVQSPKASPQLIHQETRNFLARFISLVAAMDESKFEQNKQAIISNLLQKDTRLTQRSNRYWTEIDRSIKDFNSRELLAEAIQRTSKESFMQFIEEVLEHPGRNLLVISTGKNKQVAETISGQDQFEGFEVITDKARFIKNKTFF
ncbi:MAG: peptidase M16 [Proteobacteria bacterium]|nr:MAG: peptidase M16 [Pseudomonadota bacterium]PIE40225.1 MAG: peptidase M16 [Gammaproteobacteria bacterium]